ncbi:plasma membrane proteolipid Pmp3 [Coccomyxa viridis]|uniref:Plasma membrane proteolipid Pmp3 n=1 Tax=Coccomyxa viridis TaxID=1274662 RepID=A0AAV1IEU5_9CHLO|nr:plasma membrane proteolipid Pmp3 [Coccomyxa viridis]
MAVTCSDILKLVAAFILPPLGVFLEKGTCDKDFWIDVLLTILGWLPGCATF